MRASQLTQNPTQFFDMLEKMNFQHSGSTGTTQAFGSAPATTFTDLSQLESMMRQQPSFQHANQRYQAFGNLFDSGAGMGGVGQEVLNDLFARKTPEQLAEYGKTFQNKLMQAQMNPMGAIGNAASSINKEWGTSGSVRGTALKKDFNIAAQGKWGHADIRNQVSFLDAAASGYAAAGVRDGNFYAKAGGEASVDLMRVQTDANVKINGVGELDFQGDARIGAHAQGYAGVQMGKDGVHAEIGGSAFAGAEARASGTWKSESGAQANFSAAAVAGIGAEAGAKVGFKDGKLDFNLKLGLALGVGARFNVGFSLDFNKIGQNIKRIFTDPVGLIKEKFTGFVDKIKDVGKGVVNVAKKVGEGVKKVASKVVDGVKKVGSKIKDGIKSAGKKVKNFFKKLF